MSCHLGSDRTPPPPPHSDVLRGSENITDHDELFVFLQQAVRKIRRSRYCPCPYCTRQSDNGLVVLLDAWNERAARFRQQAVYARSGYDQQFAPSHAAGREQPSASGCVAPTSSISSGSSAVYRPHSRSIAVPSPRLGTIAPAPGMHAPTPRMPLVSFNSPFPEPPGRRRTIQEELALIEAMGVQGQSTVNQVRTDQQAQISQASLTLGSDPTSPPSGNRSKTPTPNPSTTSEVQHEPSTGYAPENHISPSPPSDPPSTQRISSPFTTPPHTSPSRPASVMSYQNSSNGTSPPNTPGGPGRSTSITSTPTNPYARKKLDLSADGQRALLAHYIRRNEEERARSAALQPQLQPLPLPPPQPLPSLEQVVYENGGLIPGNDGGVSQPAQKAAHSSGEGNRKRGGKSDSGRASKAARGGETDNQRGSLFVPVESTLHNLTQSTAQDPASQPPPDQPQPQLQPTQNNAQPPPGTTDPQPAQPGTGTLQPYTFTPSSTTPTPTTAQHYPPPPQPIHFNPFTNNFPAQPAQPAAPPPQRPRKDPPGLIMNPAEYGGIQPNTLAPSAPMFCNSPGIWTDQDGVRWRGNGMGVWERVLG